jgi:FkbM family methyltransferase
LEKYLLKKKSKKGRNLMRFFKKHAQRIWICILLTETLYARGEKVPFHLISRILPENPIIVEAGAQFGEDTLWMAELWPNGVIYAFEPVPEAYQLLTQHVAQLPHVHPFPLALTNTIGETPMYLAGGASSVLRPTASFNNVYFHADLTRPIYVPCTTLDQWASSQSIKKIDFLWLDMEGNELRMLQASPSMLKQVKLIYTEVNLQPFWEGCVQHDELRGWLESQGFVQIWEDITPAWHGNALFVHMNNS